MHERGILSIPDFIANAGGVIAAAVEYHGGTEKAALDTIAEKIAANTRAVLEMARTKAHPAARGGGRAGAHARRARDELPALASLKVATWCKADGRRRPSGHRSLRGAPPQLSGPGWDGPRGSRRTSPPTSRP